jgi:hypothetical protein
MERQSEDTGGDTADSGGPDDAVYRVLRDPDRRFVVYYLTEHPTTDIETLADVLTGHRSARSGRVQDRRDRDSIRGQLRHRHLPALAAAGLIGYDEGTGRVTLEPLSEPVTRLVERSAQMDAGASGDCQ